MNIIHDFMVGETVTYFPAKQNEPDNRHPLARIVGFSATGRVKIEYRDTEGDHKATVMPYRLARQSALV